VLRVRVAVAAAVAVIVVLLTVPLASGSSARAPLIPPQLQAGLNRETVKLKAMLARRSPVLRQLPPLVGPTRQNLPAIAPPRVAPGRPGRCFAGIPECTMRSCRTFVTATTTAVDQFTITSTRLGRTASSGRCTTRPGAVPQAERVSLSGR
jgi:hypothetical protein